MGGVKMNKVMSAEAAVAAVRDGDTFCTSGFVGNGTPDELLLALAARFQAEGRPRGLTLVFAAGQGDGRERGLNRLAHPGLLRRVIGGHFGLVPRLGALALAGEIEGYNLPQGCISQLYREIAGGRPGLLTRIGLHTFVDPRQGGGRIGPAPEAGLVQVLQIDGQEWLFYRSFPIHAALLRATTADEDGNLTMERESLVLDALAMATAARNSGGVVIAQVERIAAAGSLPPRQVQVPGILVDRVVVARPEHHMQTYATAYSPAFSGEVRVPWGALPPLPMSARKIIGRRATMALFPGAVVNLGIGMPEAVAAVAHEEGILGQVTLTTEPGVIGGVPQGGLDFGAAVNISALIGQGQQFDFYDGGGLDLAFLGMAQCDERGNVNVSCFGGRLAGAGGFINITQSARRLVFLGTLSGEGRHRKFLRRVEQVTFNGVEAARRGQRVTYVTERCVLELTPVGPRLTEMAPGLDLEADVLAHMDFRPIVGEVRRMDARLFSPGPMGLRDEIGA
jgi:propionate CoA-transferase